ncbi:MAG: hypothetical protein QG622_2177 [Actinomycetota bacterium]|nr:hypothetical protein [Actinomycetota bacterium]
MAVAGAMATVPAAAVPRAEDSSEHVTDMSIAFALRMDGSMHVTETIAYDFGRTHDRHGTERYLQDRFTYDANHDRLYPISRVRVWSPSGAPARFTKVEPDVTIRVGDADTTVSGIQRYVLDYDVGGVVNTVGASQELYWNALGDKSAVPIDRVKVTVTGPGAAVQAATCYQGANRSTEPCTWSVDNGTATFQTTRSLQPKESLTVVAGFPAGTFPGAAPILQEKWRFDRAFSVNPVSGGIAAAVLALVAGGAGLLASRRGRDRRYLGITPGLAPAGGGQTAGTGAPTVRIGRRRPPVAVQFTPPKELRVGELGTLIDEHANVDDVTATIIDLAVRGHLRIEEIDDEAEDDPEDDEAGTDPGSAAAPATPPAPSAPAASRIDDWVLVKLDKPLDDLRAYEAELNGSLFEDRDRVRLSALRTTFATDLATVQRMLYVEVTERGWFQDNPHQVRVRWRRRGGLLTFIGILATVFLAVETTLGLVGLALALSGIVVLLLAGKMPARTAAGTALLAQANGFRLYLETAEADQIRFEEGQDVFSRYLPYAIVFGVAERWAALFANLAASGMSLPEPAWYVGYGVMWGTGSFDYRRFGDVVSSFSDETNSSIAAAAPATDSSSGYSGMSGGASGDGGGGGGVGSW